jgi:hypothetical protein
MDERRVWLLCDERRVEGVVRPARASDLALWSRWSEHMGSDEEDAHWDWDERIASAVVGSPGVLVLSLEGDGELQGLIELELATELVPRHGFHVNRLSTAPWNRPPVRRLRGAGNILMACAVLLSLAHRPPVPRLRGAGNIHRFLVGTARRRGCPASDSRQRRHGGSS